MNSEVREQLQRFLKEDLGDGDHTSLSCIPAEAQGKAKLLVKQDAMLAGVEIAKEVFHMVDQNLEVDVHLCDGDFVKYGDVAFHVSGASRSIVMAERLALNLMQRMSAIATKTNKIASIIEGTGCRVLDTRKTTPGLRFFEKLAVKIGGGENHRFGLYDMMMIKDNHIDYAGGIDEAISRAKTYQKKKGLSLKIEVEARSLSEVEEILKSGPVDRIMLDNFSYEDIREAVKRIGDEAETEASGGITEETVLDYAKCGVDFVSMGALTHSVHNVDLSLKAID
ncbi:carboxylating nicotinate-nucleotide diphosphorylase [Halocola ammonii]